MSRLAGHGLRSEGAPFLMNERGEWSRVVTYSYASVTGMGRGLCECGAFSVILDSAHQRKKWHRLHKVEVES